jgi:hypothetical protein
MGRAQCGPKSWKQNAISGSHNKNYQQQSPQPQRRNNTSSNNHHNHSGGTTPAATITRCVAARFFFSRLKAGGVRLEEAMAMYGRSINTNKEILWEKSYQEDPRDPRAQGRGPCGRNHTPEKNYRSNQWCVWLNCDVCALRLHYAPIEGAPQTSVALGPIPAHVEEMLSRLESFDKSEINGNMVRGILKMIQGEAQVRSSHTRGKNSTGTTTKNKEKATASSSGPSDKGGTGAKTRSTNEAAASTTDSWEFLVGGGDNAMSAAADRWEILVRRLFKQCAAEFGK